MNTSTDHKLNVNAVAGVARGARAAADLPMAGAGELTNGSLAVRSQR
jgi:hypothetical protein